MTYDEKLADRVRKTLARRRGVTEKKMFGGIAFLVNGNMACGVTAGDFMVRVGPDAYDECLAKPHVRPMDFTGRPLRGFVYVAPGGIKTEAALAQWVDRAVEFARALPEK